MDATALAHDEHPPAAPSDSDETVVAPVTDDDPTQHDIMVQAGSKTALFSTELGTRPARAAPRPPFMPPVVRSDKIQAVVDTAMFWRKKFPRVCWSIFPDQKWEIEDFFDAEDIHIYDPDHCREVIKFMSQDNVWSARKFALDWSCQYPEQFAKTFGPGSMANLFNAAQPDIFVHGETKLYPRQFLWHVLNIMRLATLDSQTLPNFATAGNGNSLPKLSSAEHELPATANGSLADITVAEPTTSTGSAAQVAQPADETPSKKNRKKTRTRTKKLTELIEPSSATAHHVPTPFVTTVAPAQVAGGKRPQSQGLPHSGYVQQIGHLMGGVPAQVMVPHNMNGQPLVNDKIRAGRQYPHATVYGENVPHTHSGAFPSRQVSGPIQAMHSPHFIPAAAAVMGQTVMPPLPLHAYAHGYPPPHSPSTYSIQPYHHAGPVYPSMIPPQSAYMPVPHMQPGYTQQASSIRGPRGTSVGDMTNGSYYANNGRPHNIEQRRSDRRNSSYGNGANGLFDPYDGTNPAFNEHTTGRRSNRGGFMEQPGRPRMSSVANNRPRTGSYENGWADAPANSDRFGDHRPRGAHMIDDPTITGDAVRGCHQTWIGPENHDVNELFVSDFPDDAQPSELHEMFVGVIGITPAKVTIRNRYPGQRPHAFVLFNSTSEAKLALKAGNDTPTVRGIPVRITVPRRFYKKIEDHHTHYVPRQSDSRRVEERDNHTVSRMPSHKEETIAIDTEAPINQTLYSPQDARSDLLKKTSPPSLELDQVSCGSPKAHKSKSQRGSPPEDGKVEREGSHEEATSAADNEHHATAADSLSVENDGDKATSVIAETARAEEPAIASPPSVDTKPVTAELIAPTRKISQHSTSSAREMKHARVQSQTKTALEGDDSASNGTVAATAVVNIPSPTKDDGPPAKEFPTYLTEKLEKFTQVNAEPEPSKTTILENDAGPEPNFTSPQEVVDCSVAPPEPTSGSTTTNHGTELANIKLEESAIKEPSPPEQTTEREHSPDSIKASAPTSAPMTVATAEDNDDTTTPITNTDQMATHKLQSYAEAAKQQGPQQTPSLNPFAKPSKSQRKKEKEQKKREQKKEQDGKAGKAKAGKSYSPTGLKIAASSTPTTDGLISEVIKDPMKQSLAQATNVLKDQSHAKVHEVTSKTADQASGIKETDEVSGKQTGGTTTTTHDAIGTVTHKAKAVPQATAASIMEESSALPPLASDAQSPKHTSAAAPEHMVTTAPFTETSVEDSSRTNDAPAAPKTKKTIPAVPYLKLNSHLPATRAQISQPTADSATAPLTELIISDMSGPTPHPGTASVASSETLHPSDAAQLSPSPTAQDFFTPMQTPALTSAPQEQTPKPKKKKNKKKKKKNATEQEGEGSDTPAAISNGVTPSMSNTSQIFDEGDYIADPFGSQLSHIDAIRHAHKSPDSYYAQVNRQMAEMAAQKKSKEESETGMVSTSSCEDYSSNLASSSKQSVGLRSYSLRHIQEFLSENPDLE